MFQISYTDPIHGAREVSKEEFLRLIELGIIIENTPVIINGHQGLASNIQGLKSYFEAQQSKTVKVKDIVAYYAFNAAEFESWVKQEGAYKFSITGATITGIIPDIITRYKEELRRKEEAEKKRKKEHAKALEKKFEEERLRREAEEIIKKQIQALIVTTGPNLEGYQIVQYLSVVSADDAFLLDRASAIMRKSNEVGSDLLVGLPNCRNSALEQLKEQAHKIGANAIIGLDFKTTALAMETVNTMGGTLYEPYLFTVTATGVAVNVQKLS